MRAVCWWSSSHKAGNEELGHVSALRFWEVAWAWLEQSVHRDLEVKGCPMGTNVRLGPSSADRGCACQPFLGRLSFLSETRKPGWLSPLSMQHGAGLGEP